jgi:hypothetical protein
MPHRRDTINKDNVIGVREYTAASINNLGVSVQILHGSSESYMCVGTYVEKDSKCDLATES